MTALAWIVLVISLLGFSAPSVAAPPTEDTSRHLYDRVMEEFQHGDYEAALAGFRFFIALHRTSALATNAQYWIGECQYRLGRYKEALDSFSNVGTYSWPAAGFKDTELGVSMKLEVRHGATQVYARVQS